MIKKANNLTKILKEVKFLRTQIKIKVKKFILIVLLIVIASSVFGFLAGAITGGYYYSEMKELLSRLNIEIPENQGFVPNSSSYNPQTSQEEAIVKVVEEASPAVVSIIITKDVPIIEKYYMDPFEDFFGGGSGIQIPQYREKGTEKLEVGGGTGFIVSEDGMIVTNKHVVLDEDADYTVFTNDGKKFPAKVLAKDPFQDLAIIKIEKNGKSFPSIKLGDSSDLRIGQTVVAIGNALGEFKNTVSVGVISGLGRSIVASGGGIVETIDDVIQTDAAINQGNSGGPLLNLKGEVIGINTATVSSAQNIGFAIPVDRAKRGVKQVKEIGRIIYPFLGIYYTAITSELQEEYDLLVEDGAWVGRTRSGESAPEAIFPGSAAEEAGIQRDDIVIEFNGEKVTLENTLAKIILNYNPGDKVTLKILREGEEKILHAILRENE